MHFTFPVSSTVTQNRWTNEQKIPWAIRHFPFSLNCLTVKFMYVRINQKSTMRNSANVSRLHVGSTFRSLNDFTRSSIIISLMSITRRCTEAKPLSIIAIVAFITFSSLNGENFLAARGVSSTTGSVLIIMIVAGFERNKRRPRFIENQYKGSKNARDNIFANGTFPA